LTGFRSSRRRFGGTKGQACYDLERMVGWGLVAGAGITGVLAAAVKGATFEALTAASAALAGAAGMWGTQQAQGLKQHGPGAWSGMPGLLYSSPTHYTTHSHLQFLNSGHPTNVSRAKFGRGVATNRQVERMVRSLDVRAAQAHMRRTTGTALCRRIIRGQRQVLLGGRERPNRIGQDALAHRLAGRDRGQQGVSTRPRANRAL
jgi:hypothetical protein